jgi:hypothetical protein
MAIESALLTAAFWAATAERAIRTFAQTAAATISTTAVLSELDWTLVGSASTVAALLAVLTAVGVDTFTKAPGPSFLKVEKLDVTES